MPAKARKTTPKKVDETVENQENPGSSEVDRSPEEKTEQTTNTPSVNQVDETVENQESPGKSEKDRGTTNPEPEEPEFAKMAPAHEVDITVINQESLGAGEVVDRNPDPVIVEDSAGIKYDVSKPYPELTDPENEEDSQRRARLRQTHAALNAKDLVDSDEESTNKIELEFVETGLTAHGTVWRKGQVLSLEDNETTRQANADTNGDVWYELSADQQKERYGKVFFEKR